MLRLEHSGNFRNLFLSLPAKPGLPTAPSTVPAKPGLPTVPSTVPAKPGLPTAPSTVPAKPGLPTAPQHSTSKARAPHSPPAQYQQSQGSPQPPAQYQQSQGSPQPPSTVPAKPGLPQPPSPPQCSISHQGPSRGLPASLQCQKKLPATRDHHRDCLPLSSTRRSSQPPGTITGTACLSPAPEEAPSHRRPSQGLPVISEHSLDIYTFKLETS